MLILANTRFVLKGFGKDARECVKRVLVFKEIHEHYDFTAKFVQLFSVKEDSWDAQEDNVA